MDKKRYALALSELIYFGKKRHILQTSLTTFVSCIYKRLSEVKGDEYEQLLLQFNEITDGKMYAEVDHARAVLELVYIWEKRGEVKRALELIMKSHVETFSYLEISEKTEFILEQMRLCFVCKELARLDLVAKKINQKYLNEPQSEQYLLKFHDYMIKHHIEVGNFIESAKNFKKLLQCETIQNDFEKRKNVFILIFNLYFDLDLQKMFLKHFKLLLGPYWLIFMEML